MKRQFLGVLFFLISGGKTMACELCKSKQPELLKESAHGAGPEGNIDLIIMWSAVLLVGITLILSLKFLVFPKEKNRDHIKYMPLDNIP